MDKGCSTNLWYWLTWGKYGRNIIEKEYRKVSIASVVFYFFKKSKENMAKC